VNPTRETAELIEEAKRFEDAMTAGGIEVRVNREYTRSLVERLLSALEESERRVEELEAARRILRQLTVEMTAHVRGGTLPNGHELSRWARLAALSEKDADGG
jgi:hypothetical protein